MRVCSLAQLPFCSLPIFNIEDGVEYLSFLLWPPALSSLIRLACRRVCMVVALLCHLCERKDERKDLPKSRFHHSLGLGPGHNTHICTCSFSLFVSLSVSQFVLVVGKLSYKHTCIHSASTFDCGFRFLTPSLHFPTVND